VERTTYHDGLMFGLLSMGYHAPMTGGIALLRVEGLKGVKRSS